MSSIFYLAQLLNAKGEIGTMIELHPECQTVLMLENVLEEPLFDELMKQSHINMCSMCLFYNRQQQLRKEIRNGRKVCNNGYTAGPIKDAL